MHKVILKRKVFVLLAAALLVSILTMGCRQARLSEIPGKYTLRAEWGKATLIMRKDGTFSEEAQIRDGKRLTVEGKWRLDGMVLSRRPCLSIDHSGVAEPRGGCFDSVHAYGISGVEISVDPDFGLAYRK